jgi:hypothetical protein
MKAHVLQRWRHWVMIIWVMDYYRLVECTYNWNLELEPAYCWIDPNGRPTAWDQVSARLISRPDRGRQPTDGCGPPSRCAYTKGGEGLRDGDDRVRWDPFSLSHITLDRSLRGSSGGIPPHRFRNLVFTGSGAVRAPTTVAPRICFYFTDKNIYAGSNDVEFIGQALWWDALTLSL